MDDPTEPVNPVFPCGHRKLDCPGGCKPSPHDPLVAEALLEAGFTNDADLGQAVRHLVDQLGMVDVYLDGVWSEVMGPDKPFPKTGDPGVIGPLSPRRCALKWIGGKCRQVEWFWRSKPKPQPSELPEGVVLDDG